MAGLIILALIIISIIAFVWYLSKYKPDIYDKYMGKMNRLVDKGKSILGM